MYLSEEKLNFKNFTLGLLGVSHKSASLKMRERISFNPENTSLALKNLKKYGIERAVLLSTCNRVEIYFSTKNEFNSDIQTIKNFLGEFHNFDIKEHENRFYILNNEEVIKHLFLVTSSLDSMVVGETQILGQVKDAYFTAKEQGFTDSILNKLFEKAICVGKEIFTQTDISKGRVSVGSLAIELAKNIFKSLNSKNIMVLGAGEMAKVVIRYLRKENIGLILVSNRTYSKAYELATEVGGKVINFDKILDYIPEVDIIICSTAAPHYILKKSDFVFNSEKHLFIIDISVPRNIDSAISEIKNIHLFDIDNLETIIKTNKKNRENEFNKCDKIIEKGVKEYKEWLFSRELYLEAEKVNLQKRRLNRF